MLKYRYSNLGFTVGDRGRYFPCHTYPYFSYIAVGYDFYTNPSARSAPLMADNLDGSTRIVLLGFTAVRERSGGIEVEGKEQQQGEIHIVVQKQLFRFSLCADHAIVAGRYHIP